MNNTKLQYHIHGVGYHPFNFQHALKQEASVVELFVSQKSFSSANPRKWVDLSSNDTAMRGAILKMVNLYNYFATTIGNAVDVTVDYSTGVERRLLFPKQICTFEKVPLANEIEGTAGFRYRIAAQGEEAACSFAVVLNDLLNENKSKKDGQRFKRVKNVDHGTSSFDSNEDTSKRRGPAQKPDEALNFLYNLDIAEYANLCSLYTGNTYDMDTILSEPVHAPTNPINPMNVFSIDRSCMLAYAAGARGAFVEATRYKDTSDRQDEHTGERLPYFDFPDPNCVWRMKVSTLFPGSTHRMYWPSVSPVLTADLEQQKEAYIRKYIGDNADEDDVNVQAIRKQADEVFEKVAMGSLQGEEGVEDFETIKLDLDRVLYKLRNADISESEREGLTAKAKLESLRRFELYFSATDHAPLAIQAIARWLNKQARELGSFCMEQQKLSENLLRFGDEMVQSCITIETLWNVNTQHRDALCLFMKQLHVYSLSAFNIHTMFHGPAKAGKSFLVKLIMHWLIEGTYFNTTYRSAKADVVPGCKHQCMLRFFEDVPPSFIGVLTNGKASDTANTDQEAMTKAWLTSGELHGSVLDTTLGRLLATSAEIRAKVHTVVTLCSNASGRSVPEAMASRYDVRNVQSRDRFDGVGLLGKAGKSDNPITKSYEDMFLLRFRRNQAFMSIIFLLIYIGVLPQVDMTVAEIVIRKTLVYAKNSSLEGIDDVRNKDRVTMLARTLVVWDAISMLWDSPDSPLKGKKHSLDHFLLIARYLRSTVEHATVALGMLSHQFEDNIVHSILENLMDTKFACFADHKSSSSNTHTNSPSKAKRKSRSGLSTSMRQTTLDETASTGLPGEVVASTEIRPPKTPYEDVNYFYVPFHANYTARNYKSDSSTDQIKALASQQFVSMTEKPLFGDLVGAYEDLVVKMVPDKTHTPKTAYEMQRTIPALAFKDDYLCLSKHIVNEHTFSALRFCTQRAINNSDAESAEYVFGNVHPRTPFLFETIRTGPEVPFDERNPNKKRERERSYVYDPDYMHSTMIEVTENSLKGVREKVTTSKGKPNNLRLAEGYAKVPVQRIDMDLNAYADRHYTDAQRMDLEAAPFNIFPNGNPLEYRKILNHYVQNELHVKMLNYPKGLPQAFPVRYANALENEIKKHPSRYSMSKLLYAREQETKRRRLIAADGDADADNMQQETTPAPSQQEGDASDDSANSDANLSQDDLSSDYDLDLEEGDFHRRETDTDGKDEV